MIDSPPVMGLADAPLIASRVEGVIYAVESHGIRVQPGQDRARPARQRQRAHLRRRADQVRGATGHYGYGYEYGYSYGRDDTQSGAKGGVAGSFA